MAPTGRAAGTPTVDDMVAGGNLVATESTGDIVSGALGTVTSVCNGRVVGFGHPMEFVGKASYGLAGADTLFVQSDSLGPSFKVANLGGVLGTVDQDRMTGISGVVGPTPPDFSVTNHLTYTPASASPVRRTGTSHVQLPMAAAGTAFYELVANHQRVLDAYQGGSENQSWTVRGHTDAGPFTLVGGNRYTDTSDITFASVWDLPDLLWLLTHVDGVHIDSVDTSSRVVDSTAGHRMQGLQQRRGGTWVDLDRTHPAVLRAGRATALRLRYEGGDTGKAFTVAVPARAAGADGRLDVQESPTFWFERSFPRTLGGVTKLVDTMPRNDQAVFDLYALDGKGRLRVHGLTRTESEVITGHASVRFVVR